MNRMTPEEIRDLMNAVIADPSASVQISMLSGETAGEWRDLGCAHWDFSACRYRIKPKARVIWVNEYENGLLIGYATQDAALNVHAALLSVRQAVRYVEQPE